MGEKIVAICPYCGCGCGFYVTVEEAEEGQSFNIDYLEEHPLTQGTLCPKGNAALEIVNHRDRLHYPLKKENGKLIRTSWEEAIELVANGLQKIVSTSGADALGFLSSAKCTNEENYLLAKLARLLGTNNIDHCTRLYHAPTLTGLISAFGAGAMTNPISDLAKSSCIFIIGSNLAENQPVIARWIWNAKEKGTKVIVADPRYVPTAWMGDIFLQLKPGTDIALINGMLYTIINENLYKQDFISNRTKGFEELRQAISQYSPEKVESITGVPRKLFQKAARTYATAESATIVYGAGITQHTTGTGNVLNLANLALICGHVGRAGTGVLPLGYQNNGQGACDMGALADFLPGYVSPDDEASRKRIAQQWGIDDLPSNQGLTAVEMINAAAEGKIKGMYIIGEEPVISFPNSNHVRQALENLEFLVVQDIVTTETAKLADVVLPAACWAEKEGSITSTERRVQWTGKAVEAVEEEKTDWHIICQVGSKLGFNFNYSKTDDILCEINDVIPYYRGITPERIRETIGGLTWPCPSAEHPGTAVLYSDRFETPDGKGKMMPVEYQPPVEPADDEYPFVLITGRVALHHNSGSMTRRSPSLNKLHKDLLVEINPSDIEKLQIEVGKKVIISTRRGEVKAKVAETRKNPPGVVFLSCHFPGVNTLTLDALDNKSKIPELKVAACRISK
ncbi:formate dehydrogenase subunit alpha [Chloroflexota bacterium]